MQKPQTARSQIIMLVFFTTLAVSSCVGKPSKAPLPLQTSLITPTSMRATGSPTGGLGIYFTNPNAPHASDYQGGPDEYLASEIDQARLSVDVAAYSLTLWSIRNALIHAQHRGVVVRMVMESDNMDSQEVQDILEAGIPIVGDQHEGLMHDKFVVIDRTLVCTGSMNFTVSGAYRDNNNMICIHALQAAADYTNEFEEMYLHHLFGSDAVADTPYPKLIVNDIPVEIYFAPDDNVANRIIELIENAQESINFLAYSFTADDIGTAIRKRAQSGIQVAGVMEAGQVASNQGSEYEAFRQAGLDVRLDGNQTGLMHHKVIIIDQNVVITGSYNFSASAEERNDENVVILFNPVIAAQYMEEFQVIYSRASQ